MRPATFKLSHLISTCCPMNLPGCWKQFGHGGTISSRVSGIELAGTVAKSCIHEIRY
ncbi:predicted protein [Plenodomus lingam JN3]|uniref:Predicted protein n=1 Tax=Leptosphaeria maculans (strain JN3 / isolate v23.1.3 / race Av1-4-5-6-7-8) TaxID=985895 RepID=E4ZYY2_LEPMJ|nr:predicted protein [Plenodomus lingam JN3]CBX96417.1 predicted protein [Plenodomus lingam JN3]